MFKKISESAKNLKNTRALCTSAILAALFVALYAVKIPLAPELRITFTFVPLAVAGWLFGPVPAMVCGLIGDIIGCILFPAGAYFPGFTLTQILGGLIFGLLLYRQSPKRMFLSVLVSKIIINLTLNVMLNSLWLSILYGKVWTVYAASHLVKNLISLPVETVLLFIIIRLLSSRGIEKMYK